MTLQIATPSPSQVQELPPTSAQLDQLLTLLVPAIVDALMPRLASVISTNTAESVTVPEFAASAGVSERLVWQWLKDGILLPAPTKAAATSKESKKTIEAPSEQSSKKKRVSEKSRTLINLGAWREKQRQQAKDCKYIR